MSFRDRKRLEVAINSAHNEANSPRLSDEHKAWLAQLMTIWASGYLEATCRDVVLTYTKNRANRNVVNFVSMNLNRFRNPTMENILGLIGGFDQNIADNLRQFSDGKVKESVNSIVGIRHQIAHGRSTDISVGRITQYFEDAKALARKMTEFLQ